MRATARRIEVTAGSRRKARRPSSASSARGETALERLVSLVLLGDLVSLYAAVLRGGTRSPSRRSTR